MIKSFKILKPMKKSKKIGITALLLLSSSLSIQAQIGEHRNDFSIGGNAGYVMSTIGFSPDVPQNNHGGMTFGFSYRYVCEKYFKTICSIYGEVNYAQVGWKEKILDIDNNPVIISANGEPMAYQRTINYIQLPIFAHLAWGRETKGLNMFLNLGPQFGIYMSESTKTNFNPFDMPDTDNSRVNTVVAQDSMSVENKFDYGIAVGLGAEYSIPKVGHFLAEARYYYGLGNIYGSSKRDYFAKSNYGQIVLKITYLFDITRTKGVKRK